MSDFTKNKNTTLTLIFPQISELATSQLVPPAPTPVVWIGTPGAGYTLGATLNVATKGIVEATILDAAGTVIIERQFLKQNGGDATGKSVFFEVLNGIATPGHYSIILYVDTTLSTSLAGFQVYRDNYVYSLDILDTTETFP